MKRREFFSLIGSVAVAWPVIVQAQQDRVRRIGVLINVQENDPELQTSLAAFRQEAAGRHVP